MPTLKHLRLASVAVPSPTIPSLHASTTSLKSVVDTLTGAVGPKEQRAVTFVDLVNLGLITSDQIPTRYGEVPSGKVLDA
jgi:hypothetical protein